MADDDLSTGGADAGADTGAQESQADAGAHRGEHSGSVMDDIREVYAQMEAEGRGDIVTPAPEQGGDDGDQAGEPAREAEPASSTEEPGSGENPLADSLERWGAVIDQLQIPKDQLVDNYMSAVVSLHNDPVGTLVSLAKTYAGNKGSEVLTALAAELGVDPYDVDVDSYTEAAPKRQAESEISQLRNQIAALQLQQVKSSGNFPLLDDAAAARAIADEFSRRSDGDMSRAYAAVVFSDPGLLAKHQAAVSGSSPAKPDADADKARRSRLRRAKAADLPRGAAGERTPTPTNNRAYDDVRAAALELGLLGNDR